jgi:hypothetical protein
MYRKETGMADRRRRRPTFNPVIQGLEAQTSLKNAGRFCSARKRSFQPGLVCDKAILKMQS